MRAREAWSLRGRTVLAMMLLCIAQMMVQSVPFRFWRGSLGRRGAVDDRADGNAEQARRLAVHVERAAARLPFATKCLPRAMALCWLLRMTGIAYIFRIAARPAALRQAQGTAGDGDLHAWVEAGSVTVIGAMPGPWLVVLTLFG